MNVNEVIAQNVRTARERKKLTLDGAAELTGVSRSMLAQIERGEVNPTISVVWKIANGYKVSFTSLVEPQNEGVSVLRCGTPLETDEGGYLSYPVFAFNEATLFETYRIVIQPSGRLDAQPHLRGTEEYVTVFQGPANLDGKERGRLSQKLHFVPQFCRCQGTPRGYRGWSGGRVSALSAAGR